MKMSITTNIIKKISKSNRPVFLIGAGIRQSGTTEIFKEIAKTAEIPILSSILAIDIVPTSSFYFGYIGSHGVRYSNFILSECDLIIALGNRLAFNYNSLSFGEIAKKDIIHVDIENIHMSADLREVLPKLLQRLKNSDKHSTWMNYCKNVKELLYDTDTDFPVDTIADIMKQNTNALFVSDVGNNQFWLMRAYVFACVENRLMLSKSFASIGCSLPKSIGAYYATRKPIICFTGDQGLLFNIQELHFISANMLPITIILLNNFSSGMIYSIQKSQKRNCYPHTIPDQGYTVPNFKNIADAFGTTILQIDIPKDIEPPQLPQANLCYDFTPSLNTQKIVKLASLQKDYHGKFTKNCS